MDMQFDQPSWWRRVLREPERDFRNYPGSGSFPRQSGIGLARATMTLAWHSVQADRTVAGVVLGMDPDVAQLISGMPLTSIDRFAARHFRRIRPRWADRMPFWRELLVVSEAEAYQANRELNLQALNSCWATCFERNEAPRIAEISQLATSANCEPPHLPAESPVSKRIRSPR